MQSSLLSFIFQPGGGSKAKGDRGASHHLMSPSSGSGGASGHGQEPGSGASARGTGWSPDKVLDRWGFKKVMGDWSSTARHKEDQTPKTPHINDFTPRNWHANDASPRS